MPSIPGSGTAVPPVVVPPDVDVVEPPEVELVEVEEPLLVLVEVEEPLLVLVLEDQPPEELELPHHQCAEAGAAMLSAHAPARITENLRIISYPSS
ncbi:hypothetical protein [Altericroceibacterium indicum]|uniref:hypothetical protein n=1 Tax=Altericroceibacterium indicum TaxID=374177 RepID=UPI001FE5C1C9|nr:hypothetical protein [Altericroceibacterium indicum]